MCVCVCVYVYEDYVVLLGSNRTNLRHGAICCSRCCLFSLQATTRGGATEFGTALQASMAAVVGIACVAIMLQQHITNKAEAAAAAQRHRHLHRHNSANSRTGSPDAGAAEPAAAAAASQEQPQQNQQQQEQEEASKPKKQKEQVSLAASFKVLAASVEIRCLAVMSLAQGLCNSLMEFAWKCHMRLLYPSPADFTAFLGEWGGGRGRTRETEAE